MNRASGAASTFPTESLDALRPAESVQSAQSAPTGATLPFQKEPDAAARVLDQLDGLTATLQNAAAADQKAGRGQQTAMDEPHQDEECLESYLQRYMQQLTGKQKDASSSPADAQIAQPAPEPAVNELKAPARQPTQAPEDRIRITAMRELANDSARQAMAARSSGQLALWTRTSYLITKVLSLLSMTLAVCYFSTRSTIALASSTVVFGAACFFAFRFVGFCRKSGRSDKPETGTPE